MDLIAGVWNETTVFKSFYSSSQRGTMTILKGKFTVNASLSDPEGCFCLLNVSSEIVEGDESSMTLVNIYAPNNHKDSMLFFANLFETIDCFNQDILLG